MSCCISFEGSGNSTSFIKFKSNISRTDPAEKYHGDFRRAGSHAGAELCPDPDGIVLCPVPGGIHPDFPALQPGKI